MGIALSLYVATMVQTELACGMQGESDFCGGCELMSYHGCLDGNWAKGELGIKAASELSTIVTAFGVSAIKLDQK